MPLPKPARSPRTNYMPLQNLKEHPRTDYMPCNTCVPYYYLIIFRSSHCHTEHSLDTNNKSLTSTTMGGPTCHHVGKASQHLHQHTWETQPTTMSERLMCIYVFWTHHFPFEGTSIWRTPSFSLKYSNFTLAIESHQGWLRPRITCELRQDWLHPRTTYRTNYV